MEMAEPMALRRLLNWRLLNWRLLNWRLLNWRLLTSTTVPAHCFATLSVRARVGLRRSGKGFVCARCEQRRRLDTRHLRRCGRTNSPSHPLLPQAPPLAFPPIHPLTLVCFSLLKPQKYSRAIPIVPANQVAVVAPETYPGSEEWGAGGEVGGGRRGRE